MAEHQRWTARRKSEVILQILRQTTTVIDVARQNDLTPSEVQEWVDTFLKAGEQGLKTGAPGAVAQTEQEIKELKATIGDLYVENTIRRKAKALRGSSEESGSCPCKANCSKTGFGRASGRSVRCSNTQPLKRVLRPRPESGEAGLSAGALEGDLIREKIISRAIMDWSYDLTMALHSVQNGFMRRLRSTSSRRNT